jgi:hypothetical protein
MLIDGDEIEEDEGDAEPPLLLDVEPPLLAMLPPPPPLPPLAAEPPPEAPPRSLPAPGSGRWASAGPAVKRRTATKLPI